MGERMFDGFTLMKSFALRLIARRRLVRLSLAFGLVMVLFASLIWLLATQPEASEHLGITQWASEWGMINESLCASPCQGCYCDAILNGTCFVNGRPSGCIGCAGTCTSDNNCECQAGVGGCGARLAWCRDSDCRRRERPTSTPAPIPTATPVPPACDDGHIYDHIEEPFAEWDYEPDYPVVVHQDPQFRGFDIVINAQGGFAETREIKLEQLCNDGDSAGSSTGVFPADCPNAAWTWNCTEEVLAHYDDPIVKIDLPMRLANSSVGWIEGELRSRYYGASRKEPLPRIFELWQGEAMAVQTGLFDSPAQDPGVHGGKIIVLTKGTPLNEPQRLALPFSVPVHLLDTTLTE